MSDVLEDALRWRRSEKQRADWMMLAQGMEDMRTETKQENRQLKEALAVAQALAERYRGALESLMVDGHYEQCDGEMPDTTGTPRACTESCIRIREALEGS